MTAFANAIRRGSRATQPAASAVVVGALYFVTDEGKTERSTGSAWQDCTDTTTAAAHALLGSTEHNDTLTGSVARGDVIVGNSTPKWARVAKGSSGQVLTSDGTDVAWATPAVGTSARGAVDPFSACYIKDDFQFGGLGSTAIGQLKWTLSGGTALGIASTANHPGVYSVQIASGLCAFSSDFGTGLSICRFADSFDNYMIAQPGAVNANVTFRFGFFESGASATNDPPNNGIYFERLAADTNWFGVTRASSTQTRTNTTVAASTSFAKFRIRRVDGSTIGFTIDAGSEVTATTNIPSAAIFAVIQVKTASGAQSLNVDFWDLLVTGLTR